MGDILSNFYPLTLYKTAAIVEFEPNVFLDH